MLKIRLLIAILIGFTLASLLSGCFSSKAAVGAKVEKSPVAQVPHKPKIDTIKITEVDPTKYPPITNSSNKKNEPTIEKGIVTNFQSQFKDGYQIAGFFPMYSQKQMEIAKINDNVLRIIQFYNGMKMGLEQLGSEGIKVSLSTYDIAGGDTVKTLLSKLPRKPDLIIGPYKMDNIVTAVDYATKNQIQVLSPWTTPGALGQVFSNIVYCRPSIKSHAEKVIQLVKSSCTDGKIIGVCRKSDIRQQNLWQNFKAVLVGCGGGRLKDRRAARVESVGAPTLRRERSLATHSRPGARSSVISFKIGACARSSSSAWHSPSSPRSAATTAARRATRPQRTALALNRQGGEKWKTNRYRAARHAG